MYVGKVIGTAISTCKEKNLNGMKLMVVTNIFEGDPKKSEIAVDGAGAGVGDYVLVTIDGGAARMALGSEDAPINNAIIGIIDYPELL